MRRIDELHLEYPFMGARMLRDKLQREGIQVGRRHIGTLMQRMGIEALVPQPDTSKRDPGHKIYPYLLRKLAIDRANQVWALDITYIPMARGFVYLTAVVDCGQPPGAGAPGGDHAGGLLLRARSSRRPSRATARRDLSTPTRAASSPRPSSPTSCWPQGMRASAWTARVPGATTSSSSGCGAA